MTGHAHRIDWPTSDQKWSGEFEGAAYGSGVCIIFSGWAEPGGGPALHQHPYSETFIARHGNVRFEVAGQPLQAGPGRIVVVPPDTPHKFTNAGPGPIEMIDIHANRSFITEWL